MRGRKERPLRVPTGRGLWSPDFSANAPAAFGNGRDPLLCEFGLTDLDNPPTRSFREAAEVRPGIRAYIGVEVSLSGAPYSTVSFFSDKAPQFGSLIGLQRGFVRHLAQCLGLKIESNRHHKALLLSEAELRLIFDNVSQNIWRLDGEHCVRRASADSVTDRLDPNWRDHSKAALESNPPRYGVKALSSASGGVSIWISTAIVPDQDGADEQRSLLVVSPDITPLKLRESELETAVAEVEIGRQRFESLYRRTPVLLCSFLSDGQLREASDLWLDKTGFARDKVVGRNLGEFMDEASQRRARDEVLPNLWRAGACEAVPLRFLAKTA